MTNGNPSELLGAPPDVWAAATGRPADDTDPGWWTCGRGHSGPCGVALPNQPYTSTDAQAELISAGFTYAGGHAWVNEETGLGGRLMRRPLDDHPCYPETGLGLAWWLDLGPGGIAYLPLLPLDGDRDYAELVRIAVQIGPEGWAKAPPPRAQSLLARNAPNGTPLIEWPWVLEHAASALGVERYPTGVDIAAPGSDLVRPYTAAHPA